MRKTPLVETLDNAVRAFRWVALVLVIAFAFSGVKAIRPEEVALVLRFGHLLGKTEAERVKQSGLLWTLPYPIDRVIRIPAKEVQEMEIDDLWHPLESNFESIDPVQEGYCITGDNNLVQPLVSVKYQISDPVTYTLYFEDNPILLRSIIMAALNHSIARMNVDDVLTKGKDELIYLVLVFTQKRLDAIKAGISVIAVEFKEIIPPRHVIKEFQDVVNAFVEKETSIKEALAYKAEEIPQAEGQKDRILKEAEVYRTKVISHARVKVIVFNELLEEYKKNPKVVRPRIYRERMEKILSQVGDRKLLPSEAGKVKLLMGEW